jgi:hypothetical protein
LRIHAGWRIFAGVSPADDHLRAPKSYQQAFFALVRFLIWCFIGIVLFRFHDEHCRF